MSHRRRADAPGDERPGIQRAVRRIAHEILERHRGAESVVIVGIHTRGVHLARLLGELIAEFEGIEVPVGELDIAEYRDDRALRPIHGAAVTEIPADISDRSVVVVDDVLYTGRTVRVLLSTPSPTSDGHGRPSWRSWSTAAIASSRSEPTT